MPDHKQGVLDTLITNRTGLVLNDNRRANLDRVVTDLLSRLHIADPEALARQLDLLPFTDELWQQLLQAITVGETYFFRNRAHFHALREYVLPDLISRRRTQRNFTLSLWSAGCATGEEPYSLAILLHEMLPDLAAWHITILGTDIDLASLERARRGVYRSWSFREETPAYLRGRWFTSQDTPNDGHIGGQYVLSPSIRNMVTFAPLNLNADDYPTLETSTKNIDLLLCRNVTIYFSEEETRRVAGRFLRALSDDGWLVVGHSEPVATVYQDFVPRNFSGAIFYQKAEPQEMPPLVPPPVSLPQAKVMYHQEVQSFQTMQPSHPKSLSSSRLVSVPAHPDDNGAVSTGLEGRQREAASETWQLAKAAADREAWKEALDLLDTVEADDQLLPHVHYLRALILLQQGAVETAVNALRQAIYCDPNFALAHYTLGDLYDRQGQRKQSRRHWRAAQLALHGLPPEQKLPLDDDVTVEMLNGLLNHRLDP